MDTSEDISNATEAGASELQKSSGAVEGFKRFGVLGKLICRLKHLNGLRR